jgi:hypothetical protein
VSARDFAGYRYSTLLSQNSKDMKVKGENTNLAGRQAGNEEKNALQGYPLYPPNEDIYSKYQEKKDIDPEDISKSKDLNSNDKAESDREKDFHDDVSGRDLDIPGSELDDKMEDIGSEDEENNYYSIGSDDHDNLDEDKGE